MKPASSPELATPILTPGATPATSATGSDSVLEAPDGVVGADVHPDRRRARHQPPQPARSRRRQTADEALQYFAQAGLPIGTTRPNDPDLDLVWL